MGGGLRSGVAVDRYACRRATTGSTVAARRAGTALALRPVAVSLKFFPTNLARLRTV